MYPLLMWLPLMALIIAIILAIFGFESIGYSLVLPIFAFLYLIVVLLLKKALRYPRNVLARISATLYVTGFFLLVLSVSVLILSLIFYDSAASRGMLRLLHYIIFIGLIVLGLSALSIIVAVRLDKMLRM